MQLTEQVLTTASTHDEVDVDEFEEFLDALLIRIPNTMLHMAAMHYARED